MGTLEQVRKNTERIRQKMRGSTQGVITSVNSDTDMLRTDASGGDTFISHPFASRDSWIRSMPSTGTRVTLQFNTATKKFDFVAYVPLTTDQDLAKYRERKSLYRVLREGEHEIKSIGGAVTYYSSRKYQSSRAGAVQTTHDGERLEHTIRAPTTVVRNHRHRNDRIGNETRFGVVKRPLTATQETYVMKAPMSLPDQGKFTYAYEYLMNLTNDNDEPLIDVRLGEVYDDLPQPGYPFSLPVLGKNGFPLRARTRYFTTMEPLGVGVPNVSTDYEVDSLGNVNYTLGKLAIVGFCIKVPFGGYKVDASLQAEITGKLGVSITSTVGKVNVNGLAGIVNNTQGKYTVDAKSGIDLKTPLQFNITGGAGVKIHSDGPAEVSSSSTLSLSGAMGKTGRPVASQATCFITGLPFFLDPTLTC